jgi:hypothetical protein
LAINHRPHVAAARLAHKPVVVAEGIRGLDAPLQAPQIRGALMRTSALYGPVVACFSTCATLLALEFAVRIHRREILRFERVNVEQPGRVGRIDYDPRLGWTPRPGRFTGGWTFNVDTAGLRSNGTGAPESGRPILTVGDSFTFGDEVADAETWPAYLEGILDRRVLNAGVSAYGIDQAVLRGELLLDRYDPEVVILSFISDDIDRTERSYYQWGFGLKPYFEYRDDSLVLRQVPVPRALPPQSHRRFAALHDGLGYSMLADAIFKRIAPEWWYEFPTRRVHRDGELVSADLLVRLDSLARRRGGRLLAVALATNGRIGSNTRLSPVVERARERGVAVLDLASEFLRLPPTELRKFFLPRGHYSPAMNRVIADRIAAFLRKGGDVLREHTGTEQRLHDPEGDPDRALH